MGMEIGFTEKTYLFILFYILFIFNFIVSDFSNTTFYFKLDENNHHVG